MALTDAKAKNIKPTDKPQKLFDGGGLFLLVAPAGGKWWRLKYRFGGKEKLLSLGTYPQVPLSEARDKAIRARCLLADGIDPSTERRSLATSSQDAGTFASVAERWFKEHQASWSDSYRVQVRRRMDKDVLPWIGAKQFPELTPPILLATVRRVRQRSAYTGTRVKGLLGQVFQFAVAEGYAERDLTRDIAAAVPAPPSKNYPALTDPRAVADLMRDIFTCQATLVVSCAMRLMALTFVRTKELRHMEWSELDFDAALWLIPGAKMKKRLDLLVPLSRQSIAILEEIRPLTGGGKYVFPSARVADGSRPMSDAAINAALARLGYKGEHTGHGFRTTASTLLNEMNWDDDAIEKQLSHVDGTVRGVYNRAKHLKERTLFMQAWADYLDGLRQGANVIPIRQTAG